MTMPDGIDPDVIPIRNDLATVRELLDWCGFTKSLEFGSDGHEHQVKALENLAAVCLSISPARREVLKHNARLYMVESWGWADFEAREALRAVGADRIAADSGKEFHWVDDVSIADLEPASPLVGHHLAQGAFAGIYGPSGSGKTFIGLDLALCVGTGHRWHGFDVVQGPVAYILAEGAGGIAQRVAAWKEVHSWTVPANLRFLLEPVRFLNPSHVAALLSDIATWDQPPVLIEVDTLAHSLTPGDENATRDMNQFIAAVNLVRRTTGAAVVVVHHTGWEPKRERGSTAFRGAVDTMIKVVNGDGVITLSCEKQRDTAPFATMRFRLRAVGDSCVVERAEESDLDTLTAPRIQSLQALRDADVGDGLAFSRWLDVAEQPKASFARNVKWLLSAEYIKKGGKPARYSLTDKGEEVVAT